MYDSRDMEKKVRDGVAIVTGAGRGLGQALCIELVNRGVRVAALSRNVAALEAVLPMSGGSLLPLSVDVSDYAAVTAAVAEIREQQGCPTILINNAAVYPHRDILDETPDSFMSTVATNLGGVLNCTLAILPEMVEQGYGRIINVGSFAGVDPAPAAAAYSVSKGAARILTRAFIADLGIRFPGIVFNDWMPGILRTEMGLKDGIAPEQAAVWGVNLALYHDRELNGRTFDQNIEVPPEISFKRRLFNRLTGQTIRMRRLDEEP